LGIVLKAIEALSIETKTIEEFVTRLNNNHEAKISQSMSSTIPQGFPLKNSIVLPIQRKNPLVQHLDTSKFKGPTIAF